MRPELNMSTPHHIYRRPFLSSWGVLALAFSDAARNVGRSTGADGHREDTQNREMLSAANLGWATKVLFTVNRQICLFLVIISYSAMFVCRKRVMDVKLDEERRQKSLAGDACDDV